MRELTRRDLGLAGLASLAFAGLPARTAWAAGEAYRDEVAGYGPLRSDPDGYLDLPEGFTYHVISRFGDRMSDGFVTPDKFDGMGCLPLDRHRVALVRNHELKLGDWHRGANGGSAALEARLARLPHFGRSADGRILPGGTTTLVYDTAKRRVERSHLSLAGTAVNCAGGVTPWGSWLTCEETVIAAPEVERSHGWIFEVPASAAALVHPQPLTAMGRFRHEAAAVDPSTGIVYLTEDREDGLFYRFLPRTPGKLGEGGMLQALAFADPSLVADSRNWTGADFPVRAGRQTRWVGLDDVESPNDDLRQRGHGAGAVRFARGEGIHLGIRPDGAPEFFFTCTSGGKARLGQIFRYVPLPRSAAAEASGGRIELFLESNDSKVMNYADNLTVSPQGHLVVCEDRVDAGRNHLRGVTPEGQSYTLARLNAETELAGACFSPDGATLFVNAYSPGRTLAISGPWRAIA